MATSRAASAGRPAANTPNGAARIASPSLQACRCWAEMGAARPRRRFSRVPRSLKPAPRNGPSSRSAIHWCQAASTWATVSAEPCAASSSPEKMAYSVSSVPAGSSSTYPSMRPQRRRICEGFMFSAGAPSASPTASPSIAPRARSRTEPPAVGTAGSAGGRCAALMVRAVLSYGPDRRPGPRGAGRLRAAGLYPCHATARLSCPGRQGHPVDSLGRHPDGPSEGPRKGV